MKSQTYRAHLSDLQKRLKTDYSVALDRITDRQGTSSVPSDSDLAEGHTVMLKSVICSPEGKTRKLTCRFDGPYNIVQVQKPDYVIARGNLRKLVHWSNLNKWLGMYAIPCSVIYLSVTSLRLCLTMMLYVNDL